MKKLALLITTLSIFNTNAFEDINCKADSLLTGGEVKANLHAVDKELLLTVIGGTYPMAEYVTSIVEEDMTNIQDLLACNDLEDGYEAEECAHQYAVTNNVLESRVFVDLQLMQTYIKEGMGKFTLDTTKIKSAKRYNVGEASKFGQAGLTLFFDKDKKEIGKFLNLLEVMECKK